MYDLLISGGTVVSSSASATLDVAVQGRQIVALAKPGALGRDAKRIVNAQDLYVLPGAIDPHTHIFEEWQGQRMPGFDVTTAAAACGGVTTVIDFAYQRHGMTIREAVEQRLREIEGKASVDYALHAALESPSWETVKEVQEIVRSGVPSLKVFLWDRQPPPEDGLIFALLEEVAACRGIMGTHAENGSLVKYFTEKLLGEGKTGMEFYSQARPAVAEAESVRRMILFGQETQASVYFFHLSSHEAVALVGEARAKGLPVYCETCPHYLAFNDGVYRQELAIQFVRIPPIRSSVDQAALWDGVIDGTISCIGTDHVPTYLWLKKQLSEGKPFNQASGGMGQVETLLPFMYSEGVARGRLTINRLVELLSTNPARIFGLFPQKGAILPGSDADIVLLDPRVERRVRSADLHMGLDYTVYEDWKFKGSPVMTIAKGKIIVEGGQYLGSPGDGEFLKRKIQEGVFHH